MAMFIAKGKLRYPRGFSLLEVVVIVAILVLLAGVTVPVAKNLFLDSKANRIAKLAEVLRDACMRYHLDTGEFAKEGEHLAFDTAGAIQGALDSSKYRLSTNPGLSSWKGPYIDRALSPADNPIGKSIWVSDQLTDPGFMIGFDFKASNQYVTGAGNMLVVELDPTNPDAAQAMALAVDGILDKTPTHTRWSGVGRVNAVMGNGRIYIFLYAGP